MAVPRVFISSTCYDLDAIRDSCACSSNPSDSILSERQGRRVLSPRSSHSRQLHQRNRPLSPLLLLIGGRFGGTYVTDPAKSIVNAEFTAARNSMFQCSRS